MKAIVIASALALGIATAPALAQTGMDSGKKSDMKMDHKGMEKSGDMKGMDHKGTDQKGMSSDGMSKMGEHSMSGTVTHVDSKKGMVKLKTEEGTLGLHFPPESLKDVKKGEKITVNLGFSKG